MLLQHSGYYIHTTPMNIKTFIFLILFFPVPFACLSVEEMTLLIQRQLDGLCYKDGVFDVR
jgi:hypothetical protein